MGCKQNRAKQVTSPLTTNLKKSPLIVIGAVGLGIGTQLLKIESAAEPVKETAEASFVFLEQTPPIELIDQAELTQDRLNHSQNAYPEVMGQFYQAIQSISNPEDLLVLVNKNHQLEASYQPSQLTRPQVRTVSGTQNTTIYLREEAVGPLEQMFEAALREGVQLIAKSGYRSYDTQAAIYQQYVRTRGSAYADQISAKPGHSEHQTGLAIDIASGQLPATYNEPIIKRD